jgi:hypothetical protein
MKTNMAKPLIIAGMALVLGFGVSACAPMAPAPTPNPTETQTPDPSATPDPTALTDIVAEMKKLSPAAGTDAAIAWEALTGPDGEYAAAASYQAVLDKFGQVEPYATILGAELKHIDALTRQLDRAGVTVPANPYLGNLEAPENLQLAAEAWAEGEILNVEMYDALLTQTTDSNLTRVLTNLRRSSQESHLPMFQLAVENGGTLTADQMPAGR